MTGCFSFFCEKTPETDLLQLLCANSCELSSGLSFWGVWGKFGVKEGNPGCILGFFEVSNFDKQSLTDNVVAKEVAEGNNKR